LILRFVVGLTVAAHGAQKLLDGSAATVSTARVNSWRRSASIPVAAMRRWQASPKLAQRIEREHARSAERDTQRAPRARGCIRTPPPAGKEAVLQMHP